MSLGQLTQPPFRLIRSLPGGECLLGIFLDLTLLPLTHANTHTLLRTGQQLLDLPRRQQRTTLAGQLLGGFRVQSQRLRTPIAL